MTEEDLERVPTPQERKQFVFETTQQMDNEFHSSVFRSSVNDQGDGEPMLTDARSNDDRIMEDLQPIEDEMPGAASAEQSFNQEIPLADSEPLEMIDDQPPLVTIESFDAIEEVDEDEEEQQ